MTTIRRAPRIEIYKKSTRRKGEISASVLKLGRVTPRQNQDKRAVSSSRCAVAISWHYSSLFCNDIYSLQLRTWLLINVKGKKVSQSSRSNITWQVTSIFLCLFPALGHVMSRNVDWGWRGFIIIRPTWISELWRINWTAIVFHFKMKLYRFKTTMEASR